MKLSIKQKQKHHTKKKKKKECNLEISDKRYLKLKQK